MNQEQQEPTLDESVAQVMQILPPVIRTYLSQGKYTVVAKGLMSKYGLRIDQAGVLEREIMLLLMGIENPDEFTQALAEEAKLDQQVINSIVQDVNDQIFVPLREQMRTEESAKEPTVPSAPAAGLPGVVPLRSNVPPAPVRTPAQVPIQGGVKSYAPPLQSPKYFHLENKIAPVPRPPVSSFAPMPPKSALPRQTMAAAPKPMDTGKLLEDHEEPHIEFSKALPVTPPAQPSGPARQTGAETPLRQALRTVLPPTNLPGTMPTAASFTPPVQPKIIPPGSRAPFVAPPRVAPFVPPAPPIQPMAAPRPAAPTPPASASQPKPAPSAPAAPKAYVADPYREPIE